MDGMKTDDQLLRGALRGRSEDFGTLTERYYRLVYGIAFSYTGNPSDAEDLTQESFLKAYRSLDTLRDIARFRAWLLRIVRNECLNWQTRKKHQDVLARCERLSPDTTVSDAEREDLFDFLWRELDELDEQFREVLTVYYFHEKNTREVAQKLDISVSAAEKRLQRARQLLGERLASRLDEALTPHHPDILRAKRVSQAVIAIPLSWDSAKVAALLGATHAAGTATGNVAAYLALAFVLGSGALMVYSVGQKGFRKPIDFGVASSAQAYEDRSRRPVTTSPIPDPSVPNVSSAGANLRSRPDFTVRVLTNGGARTPVAGARVTVFAPGSDKILAVTDERGEANFADVPLGDIGVSVVHGDYLNQRRTHLRLARGGSIDVIVAKGNAIEGRVFDAATGKPLEEFNLELIGAEPTGSEPWSYGPAPIRNKEGRFGITNLESAFALAVSAPGYSRFESRLALTRNPQSVDVAMQRAATIEGLVTDRFGQPVPGADIAFTLPHIRPGTNAETINMTRSTIDGKYSIPFTDSRYPLLVISKAGFVTQLESIPTNTIPGTTLRRNFALARTSTVRGVVRYDRRPYEGAIVNAGRGVTAMTDSFGRFIMHNVDPTTTTICATLPRRSDNQASDMTMGRSVILEEGGEQIIDFNFDRPTSAVMGFVAVDGAIDNDYDVRIRAELVGQGGVIRMEATTRAGETYLF
ncbi:MAG: sigma-70 family RNA polymerase sigma factor, partial [Candidatus Hydrogenedentes bacterium]|nr:sigma-70 family RNA polymerase sigma factor [Candidatus Hydrogenedentota bacterium]